MKFSELLSEYVELKADIRSAEDTFGRTMDHDRHRLQGIADQLDAMIPEKPISQKISEARIENVRWPPRTASDFETILRNLRAEITKDLEAARGELASCSPLGSGAAQRGVEVLERILQRLNESLEDGHGTQETQAPTPAQDGT